MKLFAFLSVFVFFGLVAAWSKEDYEIFGLQNDVATNEGANVTFYDLLEIRPNANLEQITKAYRKKSRIIHPDKVKRAFIANYAKDKSKAKSHQGVNVNQGPTKREIDAAVKNADARSARLNLVANVLRGPNRERYDHFLKNGFPLWKGTGYYYSRFRPGLGSVLVGLFLVFGGGAHYAGLILGWKRQRDFVDRYIRQARRAAWGDELGVRGIPGIDSVAAAPPPSASESGDAGAVAVNRRQKRMMDKENKKDKKGGARVSARASSGTSTPTEQVASTGERKRVVAENGKTLIVDSIGNVFLEEQNEAGERQEYLLDIDQIERPTIRQTLVCKLPIWCFNKTVGRVLGTGTTEEEVDSDESEEPVVEEAETTATSNSRSRKRNKRSQRS
ncbi:Heat shock protein DnaJ [Penicillium coprophilum]|uniref:Heat shock protein DnaJ n=1 Tax=Penicillium coprophilum TaxID=36646 RepID=UPI00238586DA|nr:Heat shock protein DnaJ [Penicillium coprophilum]KAJ5162876.1 Heat shock protein DnaJ [Penicillium coprophilum]